MTAQPWSGVLGPLLLGLASVACSEARPRGWQQVIAYEHASALVKRCVPEAVERAEARDVAWVTPDSNVGGLRLEVHFTWTTASRGMLHAVQVTASGSDQHRSAASGARLRAVLACVLGPELVPRRVSARMLGLLDGATAPAHETARVDGFLLSFTDTYTRSDEFTAIASVILQGA